MNYRLLVLITRIDFLRADDYNLKMIRNRLFLRGNWKEVYQLAN